jgi:hypothetical protein
MLYWPFVRHKHAYATANLDSNNPMERNKRPVFVVGCHRSGTNLLYDTLLSAGGFAVYRGLLPVYKILVPRFGTFRERRNRQRMLDTWLCSKGFRRSGLDSANLTQKVLSECKNGGDFMRIVMEEIARNQHVPRWAIYDPDNVLHIHRIKRDIPEALFVHIIRDGRDIAVSLKKMGEFRPFPWSRKPRGIQETAVYWEWMVRTGQRHGSQIPQDYIEIRYEELVSDPRRTLAELGEFLDHKLDYDLIQSTGLGRLRESNSSFREDERQKDNPVNRWKEKLSTEEVAELEGLLGSCLEELGYGLATAPNQRKQGLRQQWIRIAYPIFLSTKLWLKVNTPVGRFANLSVLELAEAVDSDEVLLNKH